MYSSRCAKLEAPLPPTLPSPLHPTVILFESTFAPTCSQSRLQKLRLLLSKASDVMRDFQGEILDYIFMTSLTEKCQRVRQFKEEIL